MAQSCHRTKSFSIRRFEDSHYLSKDLKTLQTVALACAISAALLTDSIFGAALKSE